LKQRNNAARRPLWLALSLLLFGAGILVKETEAVLPLLIALYEITLGRSSGIAPGSDPGESAPNWRSSGHWSRRLLPYFGVLIAYLVLRSSAMHLALHPGETSTKTALLSLPWLVCVYIRMLLWPTHLSPLYDFPYVYQAASPRFIVAVLAFVIVAGLLLWTRNRISALVMFLAGWFLITLAPALAQFRLANAQESYHDRYLYLPSFALAVLVAAACRYLCTKHDRAPGYFAWGAAVLLMGASIVGTWRQLPYWKDNYALFQHATEIAPQNERAAGNFAAELIDHRELQRAVQVSQRMMILYPRSEVPLRPAAMAALQMQDFALAESYYTRLVEMEPEESGLLFLLGISRIRLGDDEGALAPLRKAATLSPHRPFRHYTLGIALAKLGRWQEARDQFIAELAVNDQDHTTRQALADAESHLHSTF
jgi:Flp pilus assembly protein TadD